MKKLKDKTKRFWKENGDFFKAMSIPFGFGVFTAICGGIDYGLDKTFPNYRSQREKTQILQIKEERSILQKLDKNKDYVIDSTEFIYREKSPNCY